MHTRRGYRAFPRTTIVEPANDRAGQKPRSRGELTIEPSTINARSVDQRLAARPRTREIAASIVFSKPRLLAFADTGGVPVRQPLSKRF